MDREGDPLDDDRPRHFKRRPKHRRQRYGIEQWSDWFQKWYHRHLRRLN